MLTRTASAPPPRRPNFYFDFEVQPKRRCDTPAPATSSRSPTPKVELSPFEKLRQLALPTETVLHVLSQKYIYQELLKRREPQGDIEVDCWFTGASNLNPFSEGDDRPKAALGGHRLRADELVVGAGFLEGLKVWEVQQMLDELHQSPPRRRVEGNHTHNINLHRLAGWLNITEAVRADPDWPHFEASHLCHNPRCFSPYHLVFEGPGENAERASCVNAHDTLIDGQLLSKCPHGNPQTGKRPCILPVVSVELVRTVKRVGGVREMHRKSGKPWPGSRKVVSAVVV